LENPTSTNPPPGLVIRAASVDDAPGITALANLPGFRRNTLRMPFQRLETARRWLEGLTADDVQIVAVLDGTVIGSAGIQRGKGRQAHVGSLGIGVHDDHVGRGVGGAMLAALVDTADNWMDLKRLDLTVFTDNDRAIAMYRRFGFVEEGVLRAYAFREGRYVDALQMARLRGV
jgi:putative acetyltransferase